MVNKYFVAAVIGLITCAAYVYYSTRGGGTPDASSAAGVLVGTFAAITCLWLSLEICGHKAADLGKLHDERSSLIAGLLFSFIMGVMSVIKLFGSLPVAASTKQDMWLHDSWGVSGACAEPLKIGPGANEMELVIETGGERYTHRILAPPAADKVTTDGGSFELRADGSMASSIDGFEGIKFTRCD